MPAYNAESTIAESIRSVLSQTFSNFELLLINDGSTDNTLSIMESFSHNDERIRIVSHKNKGAGLSRNIGIEQALGRWVSFCDADDVMVCNKLELQLKAAEKLNADIVGVKSFKYGSKQTPVLDLDSAFIIPDPFESIVSSNLSFGPATTIVKKNLFTSFIKYTSEVSGEDYWPFLMFAFLGYRFCKIDSPLYGERSLPDSLQRSPKTRLTGAFARKNALQKLLHSDEFKKNGTDKKKALIQKGHDRFLSWGLSGTRHDLPYMKSLATALKYFTHFFDKKIALGELIKSIAYPVVLMIRK